MDGRSADVFFIYRHPVTGGIAGQHAFVKSQLCHTAFGRAGAGFKKVVATIEHRFDVTLTSEENINKLGSTIAQSLPKILGATFNTLTTIFFMYFILYFMLANGRKMENALYEYIPLRDENVTKISKEVNMMVVSNALGIPLVAFAQGVVGLIGYLIIGVKEPFFWFGVTCIAGMLPVIGAALAYIPLIIIFFANDQTWQGIVMTIYGFGVIGTVDNVLRFSLLKKWGMCIRLLLFSALLLV